MLDTLINPEERRMKTIFGRVCSLAIILLLVTCHSVFAQTVSITDEESRGVINEIRNGEFGTVTSALVMSEGVIIFEYYGTGVDKDSLHNTRSVTKTMTSMAFGSVVDDGLITVDTKIAGYFADIAPFQYPDSRKLKITAEDLLTMSSPMECDDWNSFSRGNEERMYIVEDWIRFFWNLPIRGFPSWSPKTRSEPYTRAFSYCSAGVQMLGEVVERVTRTSFVDYFEVRFFKPMGISNYRWGFSGTGRPHLMGGLELTTRGLAAFAELQRNRGRWGQDRILSQQWAEQSAAAHTRVPGGEWDYGYLWWLKNYEVTGRAYSSEGMSGNGGNRVTTIPGLGLTLVVTKTDWMTRGMHEKTDQLIKTLIEVAMTDRSDTTAMTQ